MKSENVKKAEIALYDKNASLLKKFVTWKEIFPKYLKSPYECYLNYIKKYSCGAKQVLDLCCGMGEFSFDIASRTDAKVLAVDISPESINVCKKQLEKNHIENLFFEVRDAEKLNFPESFFDVVCMSGSLSCIDVELILSNIKKWLKPNGSFIVVDTYGYNPIFNLKRRFNCLLKQRTVNTVNNIPKKATIDAIKSCFKKTEVNYFGTFAFIGPFLKYIIGESMTKKVVDSLDKCFPFLEKYAFKFVLCANNPKK